MPERLRNLLKGSDLYLFTGGGCHVFAQALLTKLPDEQYNLALVTDERTGEGLHVVATSGDLVVDALGIRTANTLLCWYTGHKGKRVRLQTVAESELFDAAASQCGLPPKNKWGFHLESRFVNECRDKAFDVITQVSSRYKVSIYLKGYNLIKASTAER